MVQVYASIAAEYLLPNLINIHICIGCGDAKDPDAKSAVLHGPFLCPNGALVMNGGIAFPTEGSVNYVT